MTTEVGPTRQNALVPLGDLEKMANWIVQSGLFGMKKQEEALALMLLAQADGQHPATIAQDYDIIAGRAARKTHSVLSRFQQAGGTVRWLDLSNTIAKAEFSHPKGGTVTIEWTIAMADKIMMEMWDNTPGAPRGQKISKPLTSKDNWKNYPRAMLRARCIAEGVRTVYPAALGGQLVVEELQDMPPEEPGRPTEVAQPQRVDPPAAAANAPATAKPPIDSTATRVADSAPTLADCKALLDQGDTAGAKDMARGLTSAEDRKAFDDALLAKVESGAATNGTNATPLQPGQQRILKARINSAGVTQEALEKHMGKALDKFTFGDYEPAQRWLLEQAEAR